MSVALRPATLTDSKLLINTVATANIGMGHLMRCSAIAEAARSRNVTVSFIPTCDAVINFAEENGFALQSKPTKKNLLLIDRYDISLEELWQYAALCKTAYIDDVLIQTTHEDDLAVHYDFTENEKDVSSAAQVIINYSIYADKKLYSKSHSRLILGTDYVPLRAEFCNLPPANIKNQIEDILLLCGGSDLLNFSPLLCDMLCKEFSGYTVHIVLGNFANTSEKLVQTATKYGNLRILHNVKDISALMQRCDIAVSAGGSTLYELCASGVPTVSFAITDNQLLNTVTFAQKKIIPYAGDVRQNCKETLSIICKQIKELAGNCNHRIKISKQMQNFVDGKGAKRIIDALFAEE